MKKIFTMCLVGVMILGLCSCKSQLTDINSQDSPLNFETEKKEEITDSSSSNSTQQGNITDFYRQFNPACILNPEEKTTYNNFSLSNLEVKLSKAFPSDFDKSKISEIFVSDFKTDENLKITSEHTYLFLTLKVTNTESTNQQIYISGLGGFSKLNQSYKEIKKFFNEPIYYSNNKHISSDKDFWKDDFKANEAKIVTIVYIFKDTDFDDETLYFVVGNSSISDSDKNTTKAYCLTVKTEDYKNGN